MVLRLLPLGNGSDVRALVARGLFESRREPEAIATIEALLRDAPDHYQARYLLAQIYIAQGALWKGMLELGRVLRAHPRHRDSLGLMGDLHFTLNALDAAEACYRRVLDQDRCDASAWLRIGAVEFGRGRDRDALAAYQRATQYDPSLATAGHSLGDYYSLLRTVRPRSRRR
jgi:tetratricopeptide (TPR) repeat protein